MRIVIFAQYAGSPKHGMVLAYHTLAKQWLACGHKVNIVASSFSHKRLRQPSGNSLLPSRENIEGIDYLWLPSLPHSLNSRYIRTFNIFIYSLSAFFYSIFLKEADVVISSSHHPFSVYAANLVKKRLNAKFIFEVRDLWPLSLIQLGKLSERSYLARFMAYAEKIGFEKSDRIVSVLLKLNLYLEERGYPIDKFVYIPNGFAVLPKSKTFLPEIHVETFKKIRNKYDFLVGYVGALNSANNLTHLIDVARSLQGEDVAFVIIGSGPEEEKLLEYSATSVELKDNVFFLPAVEYVQVALVLEQVEIAYVGVKQIDVYKYGIGPTKLNDYLAAEKPIVFCCDTELEDLKNCPAITLASSSDAEEAKEVILKLRKKPKQELLEMGRSGREWLVRNRDYKDMAYKYLDKIYDFVTH